MVSYDAFDAVVSEETALAAGAPAVHDEAPDNVLLDVAMFDTPGVDEAFADAALTVDVTTRSARQNALPLETRGRRRVVGRPGRPAARADLHAGAPPGPHDARALAAASRSGRCA